MFDGKAQNWLEMTILCPASVVKDIQTYTSYEHIGNGVDATYLVCSGDKELKVPIQEGIATLLGPTRRMEYCDAGHCCMIGYGKVIAYVVDGGLNASIEKVGVNR
jgi:hypothetical protein